MSLVESINAMPKVELHCHLLGSLRRDTFMSLTRRAAKAGFRTAQGLSEEEVEAFYTRGEKPVGVLKALRALDAELIREPADLHRIAYEYLADAAAHNVRYAEVFWNPTGTARDSGIAYPQALDALCQAFADAQRDHRIIGRLIPSIDREASPEAAQEMLTWVLAHRRPEVIGIGMDYREVDRPPELFTQTYLDAKRAGLRTTAHAGEFGMPWTNVKTAVDVLQVDRIDHGYTVVEAVQQGEAACVDLLKRCRDENIAFTVVPTNSYYLRTLPKECWARDHPIRQMQTLAGIGIAIHPNTDDPTLHHVNPTQAWQMMIEHFGYGVADMRQWLVNGLSAAWIDEPTRREWLTRDLAAFDRLFAATSI
jgi:adenine deaminase